MPSTSDPTGADFPELPDPRGSDVEHDEAQTKILSFSREAAIQWLMQHGIEREEASKVYGVVFQLGYNTGKLDAHKQSLGGKRNGRD